MPIPTNTSGEFFLWYIFLNPKFQRYKRNIRGSLHFSISFIIDNEFKRLYAWEMATYFVKVWCQFCLICGVFVYICVCCRITTIGTLISHSMGAIHFPHLKVYKWSQFVYFTKESVHAFWGTIYNCQTLNPKWELSLSHVIANASGFSCYSEANQNSKAKLITLILWRTFLIEILELGGLESCLIG